MFEGLKRRYIDWQIRKSQLHGKTRDKRFVNWNDVSHVAILVSYDMPDNSELECLLNKVSDKEVSVWCYLRSKHFVRQESERVVMFNGESLNFFSKPNSIITGKFLSESPDVLIDLTSEEYLPLKYLLGISKAHCKCGIHREGVHLYDMEICVQHRESCEELLEQVLHYLKTIQSKK